MKVAYQDTEWYPVVDLCPWRDYHHKATQREMPTQLYNEFKEAEKAFLDAQHKVLMVVDERYRKSQLAKHPSTP